jgi:uncharacterized protein (DUF1919 family)
MRPVSAVHDAISRRVLRSLIQDREFTIVSNNCWGAHVYQRLGISYRTPFVGLFLMPEDYLRLLQRLRWYLGQPLTFQQRSRHASITALRERIGRQYPIGCLDEVEIQFLHYESNQEAAQKWGRRVARVVDRDERIFVKFCDREGCTDEQLSAFDRLPYTNKVCFVAKPAGHLQSAVWIPESTGDSVPDGLRLASLSPRYFDAVAWINGHVTSSRWPRLLRAV